MFETETRKDDDDDDVGGGDYEFMMVWCGGEKECKEFEREEEEGV